MNQFHMIPYYPKYSIDIAGHVVDTESMEPVQLFGLDGDIKANLPKYQSSIYVGKLYVSTFFGVLPFPVIPDEKDIFKYILPKPQQCANGGLYFDAVYFSSIPNFDRYAVSSSGAVYDRRRNKLCRHEFNYAEYYVVSMTDNSGYRAPRKVHRIVYSGFNGELIPGMSIDHIDNQRWHNDASNLQQIDPASNTRKAFLEGASHNPWSEAQIKTICKGIEDNLSNRQIAKLVGYDYDANRPRFNHLLFRLRHKMIWPEFTNGFNLSKYDSTVNKADAVMDRFKVTEIRKKLANGSRLKDLAQEYHCTPITIAKIRDNITWKDPSIHQIEGSETIERAV